ncbi:flagellin [Rhodovulum steppense]|uniref:Flagellar hook-associated protein 3 FlgL n=1 Tax=Rhodovulum steppense TaxID=540251 RepID=A0A4R1Z0N4_9RHOB|nr:flagellin [Rhodovulum steppense]TCM87077.1 flagellar hook-associated protein 3 FlgL [Rhodovulum steppense]
MSFVSIGDLSRGYALRTQNTEVKARISRLGQEVSTGLTADPAARLRGDFRALGGIERGLKVMDSYDLATKEAAFATEAMQHALGQLHQAANKMSSSLMTAANMFDARTIDVLGADAKVWLDISAAALNAQVGGRTLFAGAATNGPALATGPEILAEVQAAVAGLTSAQDVLDAVDLWFDTPGGGFETLGYLGSDTPVGPVRLNDRSSLTLDVTASDPGIRTALRDMVAGALLSDDTLFGGDLTQRKALAIAVGERLLTNSGNLTVLQGEVGTAQAQVETIRTENASSRQMLELARLDMLAVDPYDAASELKAAETQLETIYAVTARLSRLSLVDYLR